MTQETKLTAGIMQKLLDEERQQTISEVLKILELLAKTTQCASHLQEAIKQIKELKGK